MPIYQILNTQIQGDYESFPIFGLLLYSDQDSDGHIGLVLSTEQYLEKINAKSGLRWNIYSLKLLTPIRKPYRKQTKPGTIEMLTMMPDFVLDDPNENKSIMQWFNIYKHSELPCFVIFTFDQKTKEMLYLKESFEGTSPADTFNKLYTIIKDVASALDDILLENLGNRAEIFEQIKVTLSNRKELDYAKKMIGFVNPIELLRKAASLLF